LHLPAKFSDSLLDSSDAKARGHERFLLTSKMRRQAVALIFDLQTDTPRLFLKSDACDCAPGVALDVGECFLNDPKHGSLQFAGETSEFFRRGESHSDSAALLEAPRKPSKARKKPCLINQGWVQ
jgi:hypothetical protein